MGELLIHGIERVLIIGIGEIDRVSGLSKQTTVQQISACIAGCMLIGIVMYAGIPLDKSKAECCCKDQNDCDDPVSDMVCSAWFIHTIPPVLCCVREKIYHCCHNVNFLILL